MSVIAFLKQFPDDDACWAHLERVPWPDGPACPKCGNVGPTMKCGRAHYHLCQTCNAKFTVAMGTPLEGTRPPMRTWFTALYLLAVSSKGLSSVALGRHLGIGQKTAWFLGRRIRAMMAEHTGLLKGIVEADETDVGGKRMRGKKSKPDNDGDQPKGRGGSRKAMVLTAVERGGKLKAKRSRPSICGARAIMLAMALSVMAYATAARAQDEDKVKAGEEVWKSSGCPDCHGPFADGDKQRDEAPTGANIRTSNLDAAGLKVTISCGRPGGAGMPAFDEGAYKVRPCYDRALGAPPEDLYPTPRALTPDQIDAVVAYLVARVVGRARVTKQDCLLYYTDDPDQCEDVH